MMNLNKIIFQPRNIRLMLWSMLVCTLLLKSNVVFSAVTCAPNNASLPRVDTVPIAPINISAGVDFPIGLVIYKGLWLGGNPGTQITCETPNPPETFDYAFNVILQSSPMPLSSWSGSNYPGKIYETGIPGIGVALTDGATAVTLDSLSTSVKGNNVNVPGQYGLGVTNQHIYISFIKIGTVTPGSYSLSSANLPSVKLYYDNLSGSPAVPGFPITTNIINFSGTITINAPTCTTPDVNVPMGTYNANKDLSGVGSATQWIKTGLQLQNCPTFYGYYNADNTTQLFNYGGASSIPASTSNKILAYFSSNTGVINASTGIINVDASASPAATGVGIQLGWGDGTPTPVDFNTAASMTLPKDGTSTISLPLYARYIQTDPKITPGKANGKVTFTINYN